MTKNFKIYTFKTEKDFEEDNFDEMIEANDLSRGFNKVDFYTEDAIDELIKWIEEYPEDPIECKKDMERLKKSLDRHPEISKIGTFVWNDGLFCFDPIEWHRN